MQDEDATKDDGFRLRRLEYNRYALEKVYQRLQNAVDSNHEQEIYTALGETLLWIMTTDEWHLSHDPIYKERRDLDEKGQLLLGLKHAYNSMKHNMYFIKIHNKMGGAKFPISFPIKIPVITVHWMIADELMLGNKGKLGENYENYKRYIEEKEVLCTFELAMEFLNEEYIKIVK
ncbi:hypothetical protein [Paenibacillus glacialis]|uniref:Uncharacterized protein n=1 Tax=Paenibacillus glacialis TaxID=494026 RepID=A0A162Q1X6_9BACL|nr:hypothetical protein [Paenibacillus glacialis]OAB41430.1 hypothetical protein PGLA_16650 [Paenibacillus glacialis]